SGVILMAVLSLFAGLAGAVAAFTTPQPDGQLVRIVQPNIGQEVKWDPGFREEAFQRHQRLTGAPADEPRLILWPEAATPEFIGVNPQARNRIANLVGPGDVLMLG